MFSLMLIALKSFENQDMFNKDSVFGSSKEYSKSANQTKPPNTLPILPSTGYCIFQILDSSTNNFF